MLIEKNNSMLAAEGLAIAAGLTKAHSGEFRRGGAALFAAAAGTAFTSALPVYVSGFFIDPLTETFGWSKAQIGLWVACYMLAMLLFAPIGGRLVDRFGVRRTAPFSMLLLAATYAIGGQFVDSIPTFYLFGVVLGIVAAGSNSGTFVKPVLSWFVRNRGLAIGLTMAGHVIGVAIASYILPRVIEPYGWRAGYLVIAGLILVAFVVVVAWLREAPASAAIDARHSLPHFGMELKQAARTPMFWLLAALLFLFTLGAGAVIVHLVPFLAASGIPASSASAYVIAMSLTGLFARVAGGYLMDRISAQVLAIGVCLGAALAAAMLWSGDPVLIWIAVVLVGMAMGAEVDLMSYMAAGFFGAKNYASIFGLLYAMFGLGAALGPALLGKMFDATGNYQLGLVIVAAVLIVAAIPAAVLTRFDYLVKPADMLTRAA